jgi:3-methylcrotonyl-CoA carboxylase alpha subunit
MRFIAKHESGEFPVEVERYGGGYLVRMNGQEAVLELVAAGESLYALRYADGRQQLFLYRRDQSGTTIDIAGKKVHLTIEDPLAAKRFRSGDVGHGDAVIKAIMPGRVIRISVAPGDEVKKGSGLLILEAMKMENEISAPRDGKIAEVHVAPGATVEGGAPLVTLEAVGHRP